MILHHTSVMLSHKCGFLYEMIWTKQVYHGGIPRDYLPTEGRMGMENINYIASL